ncbi:unnamed protein product [Aspergillus oryzae]|nr:unnamed protein product [Aspergillus oryzae]GMF92376.1 unnamed protein product [Aspergillus oryzae]
MSGHSTPSGPQIDSRSNSPLPRRPTSRLSPYAQNSRSQPSRPGSSLSNLLTPSDSTTSLSATQRADDTALKQFPAKARPSNVADPLDVLNDIIGKRKEKLAGAESPVLSSTLKTKPSQLVAEIDFGGLSLEEFVTKPDEPRRAKYSDVGAQTIQQFEKERDKFQDLHSAITGCDDVSRSVEKYLNDFQTELGAVSAEIETLQTRSIQLNAMLANRRNVEQLLGPAVEEISISPNAVRLIVEGPIDENWVKALNEIESRAATIEAKVTSPSSAKSVEDVRPLLSDIKKKAVERIRDYLVSQIRALRSPNINAQIIQQQRLFSVPSRCATESDIAIGNFVPGGRAGAAAHDPFSLGRRIEILRTGNHMAISSYVAEEDTSFHGIEAPFRNFNLALMDNVSAEYSFMTEMFSTLSFQQISRKATEIFDPVFALGQGLTKRLVEHTTDSLGVLICVRLNQQAAFELQRRKVPVADAYINGVNIRLWPRFQVIMDLHCESLKRVASHTGRSAVSALSLAGGDDLNQSSAPHFLTQRFGQLLHGILVLSSEAGDDEPVSNSLSRLAAEFDSLLAKLSRIGGDAKRRERFLFNNYSLILTIISVIHAGLYYGVDTLKTKLCIKGKEMMYDLCARNGLPHRNTKKWIVAQTEEQWAAALKTHEHAQKIGVPTRLIGRAEAQALEPEVQALAGIVESPTTGIVDSHSLMTYLQGDFEDRGGDCAFLTNVTGIEALNGGKNGYRITAVTSDGTETSITAETLVNSAGNYACYINNMVLPPERHRTPYYAKGTYFSYAASFPKTSVLVYPATLPGHGGLGTHLTLDLGGRIRFGPDVEWVDDPNDLVPSPARLQQALREIKTYLPNVDPEAISLDYCGIRPKLERGGAVNTGKGFQDFIIQEEEGFPGFINLLGIESPGLTSSLAIGEMVKGLLYGRK